MKKDTYRNRAIAFGCLSVPFIATFVITAVKGELTINAIPGTLLTLLWIFLCVLNAVKHVKYLKENFGEEMRAKREAFFCKMKFRRTRKMGFIWLDEKHMLFKIRFSSASHVFMYSELVDFAIDMKKRPCSHTDFYEDRWGHKSAYTTYGEYTERYNLILTLTWGRKKIYNMLNDYYKKDFDQNLSLAKEALRGIRDCNRMTAERERVRDFANDFFNI